MALVRRQRLDAERRPPVVVDGDREAARPLIGQQSRQHVEEAVHPVHRDRIGERMERPVQEARVVDEQ